MVITHHVSRLWAVLAIAAILALGGLCQYVGDQANASLKREYEVNALYAKDSHIVDSINQAAILNAWLRDEFAEQRHVLKSRVIRLHQPPF